MVMMNKQYIEYTLNHRKAFSCVEKELVGKISFRSYFHDLDKLILYHFLPKKLVTKIYRLFSNHHLNSLNPFKDYISAVIDWECARYTKSDKPLSARDFYIKEFINTKYSQKISDTLNKLHL